MIRWTTDESYNEHCYFETRFESQIYLVTNRQINGLFFSRHSIHNFVNGKLSPVNLFMPFECWSDSNFQIIGFHLNYVTKSWYFRVGSINQHVEFKLQSKWKILNDSYHLSLKRPCISDESHLKLSYESSYKESWKEF